MGLIRFLGYLWALPVTIVGLLVGLVYWPLTFRWSEGALDVECKRLIPKWIAGQTWGFVVYYKRNEADPPITWPRLRAHERVHVRQCMVLGPLVLVLYPLASLASWAVGGHYYRDNWFELQAKELSKDVPRRSNGA